MRSKLGFTLIELMIAISIIAVISAVGFTTFSQSQQRGRDSRRKSDLRSISVALELYYQKNKRYPCGNGAWQTSTAGGNWIVDNCPYPAVTLSPTYINQTPLDPLNTGPNPWLGSNYSYAYFNGDFYNCKTGQNYILLALLENKNDPDVLEKKLNFPCGVNFGTWSVSHYLFVLSN